MSVAEGYSLPDRLWGDTAASLEPFVRSGDLLLAPPEFLQIFPGTIALHVPKRMLFDAAISHYVLHKGMFDRVDPAFMHEAAQATPVFANEVFVVFSTRGEQLPDDQIRHLSPFHAYLAGMPPMPPADYSTGVVVTTYNRPSALRRTLTLLARQRRPILVVDDGSSMLHRVRNRFIAFAHGALYALHPVNLGLSNAINIGVGHWLAHPQVEWISVFNDDVEVVDGIFDALEDVLRQAPYRTADTLYTGYFDPKHATREQTSIGGRHVRLARSCSGQHLHAHRNYWQSVLPVPTAYIGAPKRTGGRFPGHGSDSDWWIASWAPRATPKRGGHVVVIPDLVSTFAADAASSTWGNEG